MNEQLLEIWKPVKGYEGLYEISNFGRVMSCKKTWKSNRAIFSKDRSELFYGNKSKNKDKHLVVNLCKYGIVRTFTVHELVWIAFGNEPLPKNRRKIHIDHIDENEFNNHIDNLRLLTVRENANRGTQKNRKLPRGVSICPQTKKYQTSIMINGKHIFLGRYPTAIQAQLVYQKKLIQIGEF